MPNIPRPKTIFRTGLAFIGCATLTLLSACAATDSSAPIPTLAPLTSAEADAIYIAQADQNWDQVKAQFPNAQRPDAELVRAATVEERPELLAECLRQEGYDVYAQPDGAVVTENIPLGQEEALMVSRYRCEVEYPFTAELNRAPTDAQLHWLYDYYVHELTECLANQGAEPSRDAPSEEVFISALKGENDSVWSPYDSVEPNQLEDLRGKCPEFPEEYYGRIQ